jgi:hypothetical protein
MANKNIFANTKKRITSFLKRRPHRSFRMTRRHDYSCSLKVPGYFNFTNYVWKVIWSNRKTFSLLALVYAIATFLMVGIASQDTYKTISDTLDITSDGFLVGAWGNIGKAGLLSATAITGGMSQSLSDTQQVYAVVIILLTWMTSVWLLRNILAGNKVKVRDGLYNSGSPILSTFLVALLFIVQLLPLALALLFYSAAVSSGLLSGGVEAMLFWVSSGLLCLLSLYWITSTIFALIIVTLPGMYPYQAIKTAGDIVVGRRLRILLRFLWMGLVVVLVWAIIMIPIIMMDGWIKSIWAAVNWLPTIPIVQLALSSMTIIWVSSYVYLLYRKVVADDFGSA